MPGEIEAGEHPPLVLPAQDQGLAVGLRFETVNPGRLNAPLVFGPVLSTRGQVLDMDTHPVALAVPMDLVPCRMRPDRRQAEKVPSTFMDRVLDDVEQLLFGEPRHVRPSR